MKIVHRSMVALSLGLMLLTALGCGRSSAPGRVIVLGIDGVDPSVVDLLMSEGKMPNFAKMKQFGAHGRLLSRKPLLSPIIWTTIATGKTPDQHGIGHFVAVNQTTGERLPVTSEMRRVKALWNILSGANRTVAVVGWWATWPAEEVRGVVVSDHTCYHFLFPQGSSERGGEKSLTYPEELFGRIAPFVRRPDDVTPTEAQAYIQVSPEELSRPFDFNDDVGHFKWALATGDSYRSIGADLWKRERPNVLMVYIEGVDSISHLFGHLFRAGELAGELAVQQTKFGQAVEQMYLYADRLVGDYIDLLGNDATLVVVSDHGFQLGAFQDDPSKTRDMRRVSEQYHSMEGIVYLYGKGVRRGRIEEPSILDVTPTVLALTGLPPAEDMPGRVWTEALGLDAPPTRVATYETGFTEDRKVARDTGVDPEILERLKSLGYVDESQPGSTGPGGASSPESERNLAGVLFESGRYEEAAAIYSRLLQNSPDNASLHTSLAGTLGALHRFDEAMAHLDKAIALEPLNVEAYHNKAVILERRGSTEEAIEHYRTAVRYNPKYEPSRRALVRLTGSADVHAPRDEAEARALALAEEASGLARRGDYAKAMGLLEQAAKVAPKFPLVYQYESNVAYLMGDVPRAIRALEKAVELEPGNALFKTNLERLKATK